MNFAGIQRITLLDYPGKIATTVFTYGCNFRCPFCHNPELVTEPLSEEQIVPEEYVLDFLKSRENKLDAFVVTGGEPLLHSALIPFLQKVKDMEFLVKVDTNGSFPEQIEKLLVLGIVDYWAMDIKNDKSMYHKTCGITKNDLDLNKILKSIELIKTSGVDYEFRSTVVPDLHTEEFMHGVGKLIKGSKKFYIQNFRSGKTLDKSYSNKRSFLPNELKRFKEIMEGYVDEVSLRGL